VAYLSERLPPAAVVQYLSHGYMVTAVLGTFAELGVADHLADEPTAAAIARKVGVDADSLYRLLRCAASFGLVIEVPADGASRFRATPLSDELRGDGEVRTRTRTPLAFFYDAFGQLPNAMRTGQAQFAALKGKSFWDWLAEDGKRTQLFSRSMSTRSDIAAAVSSLPVWADRKRVLDVGGALGAMTRGLLLAHPHLHGAVLDLPHVVEPLRKELANDAALSARFTVHPGSFFEPLPKGADAVVLSRILHDWNNESSARILSRIREAVEPGAKLFVIEIVVPPPSVPSRTKYLDLMMMLMFDGRERTEAEYAALFTAAGFRLGKVHSTPSEFSVLEAVAV